MSDHNYVMAKVMLEQLLYKAATMRYPYCEEYTCSIGNSESSIKMVNKRFTGDMTNVVVRGKGLGRQISNVKKGKVQVSYY